MNTTNKTLTFFFILFLLTFQAVYGQKSSTSASKSGKIVIKIDREKNLKESIDSFSQALLSKNYEKLAKFIFIPKVFANDNSDTEDEREEKEFAIVKVLTEKTEIAGMKFRVRVKSPQNIEEINNNLFSIVSQETIITIDKNSEIKDKNGHIITNGEYKASGYFLAISEDKGKTWKFWNEVSKENLEIEFPQAAKKINLPQIIKPVFLN